MAFKHSSLSFIYKFSRAGMPVRTRILTLPNHHDFFYINILTSFKHISPLDVTDMPVAKVLAIESELSLIAKQYNHDIRAGGKYFQGQDVKIFKIDKARFPLEVPMRDIPTLKELYESQDILIGSSALGSVKINPKYAKNLGRNEEISDSDFRFNTHTQNSNDAKMCAKKFRDFLLDFYGNIDVTEVAVIIDNRCKYSEISDYMKTPFVDVNMDYSYSFFPALI
ncbi:hypothetical protein [Photobacterium leiognathi]|uniref:hypothetical protein n=1 Tax=Photobacterium leiognathi TaxID=553611 RepID=UPI0029813259|nr:hypothetical protein [Photobacterium leiognathi]